MADRYPKAAWDPFTDGGSFTGGPAKGLLHTTEGYSYEGARSVYASKAVAPHFTVSHQRGYGEAWQHVPINRASRALRNAAGGVQTNRDSVIQIEIVGFAQYAHELPRHYLDFIAELMRWIEANASVPRRSDVTWVPYPQSYGTRAAQRLSASAWDNYSGWLGHMHVPEGNAHGDPGLIDITYLLGSTTREETDMYVLHPDGGVWHIVGERRVRIDSGRRWASLHKRGAVATPVPADDELWTLFTVAPEVGEGVPQVVAAAISEIVSRLKGRR